MIGAGTRLGPYEILSCVGAGGMGEVYRARDTRLDRTVAVKVLPPHLSSDAEARARFEREARAISALNDPHICTLHDVGNEGGVAYLVMELLEGETLADVLSRGKLPLDRALRYGIEIATALDRAHRQGIVHRDLKPGNVMVTRSGVKLLDFGLARLHATQQTAHDTPTVTSPITTEGMVVGTLQYMSPEQLEGKTTDTRTDLFALGCILYEMVTGRRAFGGGSQASIISAIMNTEPPPMATITPVSPPTLERIVRKCLEKNADDRWRSAGDLATELRWIVEEPGAIAAPAARARAILPWSAAAVLLLAAIVLLFLLSRSRAEGPVARLMMPIDTQTIEAGFYEPGPVISPDGRYIAYAGLNEGKTSLWLRRLGDAKGAPIPNTDGARAPFWSPDSRFVGYALSSGKLMRASLDGNENATICDTKPGAYVHAAWVDGGTIVFTYLGERGQFFTVPSRGGTPVNIAARNDVTYGWPKTIRGRNSVVYCTFREGNDLRLHVRSLDRGETRELGATDSEVEIVDDVMLWVRDASLYAQRVDRNLARKGEPVLLASGVSNYVSIGAAGFTAASDVLAFISNDSAARATWFTRAGAIAGVIGPNGALGLPRLSHDGRRAVLTIGDPMTGTADLWMCDVARNTSMRVTNTRTSEGWAAWSSDDQMLAFSSDEGGPPHVYVQRASGGKATMITPPGGIQHAGDWTPDGKYILYSALHTATRRDLWLVAPQPQAKPVRLLQTPFYEGFPRLSPDGKWIAYISDNSGMREAWVAPFADPGNAVQLSSGRASQVEWSADGREIYFGTPDNRLYAVPIRFTSQPEPGSPQFLFREPGGADWNGFDVTPDGQKFLINRSHSGPLTNPLHVIVNWKQLLDKK